MRLRVAAPALLLLLAACSGPKVVPTAQDPSFQLAHLRDQAVAVWPLAVADLDESTAKTVAKEYKDRNAFLDALSTKLSNRVLGLSGPGSLDSGKVTAALAGQPTLLDPTQVLGAQDPNNRFASGAPSPGLTTVLQQPFLQGVRYLILPRDLRVGRSWHSNGPAVMNANGTMTGGGSSAKTQATLRLAVVDAKAGKIVWDGSVTADAGSSWMKGTALHEVEDDLGGHLSTEILGAK